jgi:hypothetical protein
MIRIKGLKILIFFDMNNRDIHYPRNHLETGEITIYCYNIMDNRGNRKFMRFPRLHRGK